MLLPMTIISGRVAAVQEQKLLFHHWRCWLCAQGVGKSLHFRTSSSVVINSGDNIMGNHWFDTRHDHVMQQSIGMWPTTICWRMPAYRLFNNHQLKIEAFGVM